MRSAVISGIVRAAEQWMDPDYPPRAEAVADTLELENRFTFESITFAINQQMSELKPQQLTEWIDGVPDLAGISVGVLGAGNIPLVDLQDFVAVVLSGSAYRGAVSSQSPILLPAFSSTIQSHTEIDVSFYAGSSIEKLTQMTAEVDAVVGTGATDTVSAVRDACRTAGITSLLLRNPSFGVALLDGTESQSDLDGLAEDVFLHDGRGCRSVAVVFAPEEFSVDPFLDAASQFRAVFPAHEKTVSELRMRVGLLESASLPCAYPDNKSFLVSRGDADTLGPGHLRWTTYTDFDRILNWIASRQEDLQLVVAGKRVKEKLPPTLDVVSFGDTQRPPISWRPDGVSVVEFLAGLAPRKLATAAS